MPLSSIVVRPLVSSAERELHLQWSDQEFPLSPSTSSVLFWHRFVTTLPDYEPEQIRGAFLNGEQAGGYIIYKRVLRIGAALLPIGSISAVVTRSKYRNQGVATALMHDAFEYAISHNYALLLLDGIPKFYHRYGYSDVFDLHTQDIDCSSILAQPPSLYKVRQVTLEDADMMLALYNRHYGPYTGSFVRTLEQEIYWLRYRWPKNPLVLTVDSTGQPRGYLSLADGADRSTALEIVADDWPATIALLQYHAQLLSGSDTTIALHYRMPPTSPMLQWMIDRLEVPDTSYWRKPVDEWAIHCHSYHHKDAGWLACLVCLPTLAQAMLPEWQLRWKRSLAQWSGFLSLVVGEEECTLHIQGSKLCLVDKLDAIAYVIQLTSQEFTQLVFGYRSATWALQRSKQPFDEKLLSILNVLFPFGNTWIPASDGF